MSTKVSGFHHRAASDRQGVRFKSIRTGELTLMTIGGIMGSGLFLASGQAIRYAGPAVALGYLAGVLVMAAEMGALAEMAAADPIRGNFITYTSRVLGRGPAFTGGWIFWFSSILNMAAEATAAALFTRMWLSGVPVWAFSLGFAALVAALNFLPVRGFGEVESVMSGLKILAVGAFLVLGVLALTGHAGVHPPFWRNFAPRGPRGVGQAMILVLFSLSGTGILGMAAPDTRAPGRTIPAAIRNVSLLVLVFYVGAALLIPALVPWQRVPTHASPFVAALNSLRIPYVGGGMNLLILVAVLSALNAGLYSTDRVLVSLARDGYAPGLFGRLSIRKVPVAANALTGTCLTAAASLIYFLPQAAYLYLVSATGLMVLFIWALIIYTQIRYRPWLERHKPERLHFRMPGHPYTSWLALVLLTGILGTAFLASREAVALILGVAASACFAGVYFLVRGRLRAGA